VSPRATARLAWAITALTFLVAVWWWALAGMRPEVGGACMGTIIVAGLVAAYLTIEASS